MWELTKRISLRISSVLSMVEQEPGAGADPLHRLRLRLKSSVVEPFHFGPAPAPAPASQDGGSGSSSSSNHVVNKKLLKKSFYKFHLPI